MTDNKRHNDPKKVETVETETTERTTTRHTNNRAPRRDERRERNRDGVGVYAPATSALPAGTNLSWGSIIAGAVSATAVFIILSLITAALGFGLFSPTNANPLSGVGVGTGIWTAITLILSFLAGGFIAGYSARQTGKLHGAITWALSLLLLFGFAISAISSALGLATKAVSSVAGTAANVAGSAISSTADVVGSGIQAGFDAAGNAIGDVDTTELQNNVETYLADTDIPELQPEYLNGELQAARDEVTQAVKDLALNPNNANAIISSTVSSLQNRANTIANAADRDAIANAVANNSELSQEEAEEITDNIYNGLVQASKTAQNTLDQAATQLDQLSTQAEATYNETMDAVAQGTEDASNAISAGSVITFIGLILALLLSAWGGQLGEQKALEMVKRDTIR